MTNLFLHGNHSGLLECVMSLSHLSVAPALMLAHTPCTQRLH